MTLQLNGTASPTHYQRAIPAPRPQPRSQEAAWWCGRHASIATFITQPKLQRDDYHLLYRKQQVTLVRLRTGHNRLNSHMHRKLKLAPSPTCPCGREEQTVEHVLQRCPLYKATREDVWPVSTSLTTKLYGCRQELEKTTSFISRAALIV